MSPLSLTGPAKHDLRKARALPSFYTEILHQEKERCTASLELSELAWVCHVTVLPAERVLLLPTERVQLELRLVLMQGMLRARMRRKFSWPFLQRRTLSTRAALEPQNLGT